MLDEVAELIREVATTIVLPRFRHLSQGEVHQKAPGDVVTIADAGHSPYFEQAATFNMLVDAFLARSPPA